MAKRKRTALPKDFGQTLERASLDELVAVFDACDLEARGGYARQTALGFYNCPDALVRWLVAQGADLEARDGHGRTALHHRSASWMGGVELLLDLGAGIEARDAQGQTPLHAAARSHKPDAVRALVARGADVHAENVQGQTPLRLALVTAQNSDIAQTAAIAEVLLAAGAAKTDAMRGDAERIGHTFEFGRAAFNPEYLDEADAGLAALYRLFGATPAAPRRLHDGVSPIRVPAGDWPAQHQALWELLVPPSGPAATAQGEAIRISGRLWREISGNGGANWDADFEAMLAALPKHLGAGTPLPPAELSEADALANAMRAGTGDDEELARLAELAVRWVAANPDPIPLAEPAYRR
ncbi:ankyrin repeat domain-containing protein [Luteimonas sp. Y-2-2-4F]|nr:ankyrin repeat domain-containing protein [Luteimonas sp. Y-2-2-4F]MCD9032168.1 ankyrin repeat domain-containing protein [Luteimonas sp. Y-2-2-4F]